MTEFSAGGIVVKGDQMLIVFQKRSDSWAFPKGHIMTGETPIDAARREIFEETGIRTLTLVAELGSYERGTRVSNKGVKNITMFLFTTTEYALAPQEADVVAARWCSPTEAIETLSYIDDRRFFVSRLPDIEMHLKGSTQSGGSTSDPSNSGGTE